MRLVDDLLSKISRNFHRLENCQLYQPPHGSMARDLVVVEIKFEETSTMGTSLKERID